MSVSRAAHRISSLRSSEIIRIRRECERVGAIDLAAGISDSPPPAELIAGAQPAFGSRGNIYSLPEGVPELRRAIATKLRRDNGITADPDSEIVVTVGTTGGFAAAMMGLLNPGDEVLILDPYYGWHWNAASLAGCVPIAVRLDPPRFRITEETLRGAVTPRARALVICTPANPTGRVYDAAELDVVGAIAEQHDLLVITDETYEYFAYDERRHVSPASLPSLAARTISLMSISKTFNASGWRIGYAVAPPDLLEPICRAHDFLNTCAPTPLQHAAAVGLQLPPGFYRDLGTSYQQRRDILCDALAAAKLDPLRPEGAFFVLADISGRGFGSADDAAEQLLRRVRVAGVPASSSSSFGSCDRFVRFCFARDQPTLIEAAQRIRRL